jgi:hypothetical protein
MSKVLSIGQINRFAKDDNNNLDKDSCLEFIKLYEKSNGKISSIENPITKRRLTDAKRIKFIYEKCLGYFNSKTPKPINDNKVLYKLPKQIKDKKVLEKLTQQEFAIKIIEDPMMNTNDISKITKLTYGIDNKENRLHLKQFLEDEDEEVSKIYRNCILEIRKYIKDFCPFMGNKKFTKSVKKHVVDECIFEFGTVIFSSKVKNIFNMIIPCINESILYSSSNDNLQAFGNNLKNNYPKHYSIKYMLNVFDRYSITTGILKIDKLCIMIDELINYDELIIKNQNNNLKVKIDEVPYVNIDNIKMLDTRISISYKLNDVIDIELFKVFIPNKFKINNTLIPNEYSFDKLFKTIQTLVLEGKLLGKSMPYKMHRSLHRYRDKKLKDEEEYINFFNLYYRL